MALPCTSALSRAEAEVKKSSLAKRVLDRSGGNTASINKYQQAQVSRTKSGEKKPLFAMRPCTVRNCLCPSLSPSTDVKLQCLHHVSVGGPKSAREDQCKGGSCLNSRGSRIWQTWGPLTPRSPPKLNLSFRKNSRLPRVLASETSP